LLTILLDYKDDLTVPATIRQIFVDKRSDMQILPTGIFEEAKSNQFFENN